MAPQAALRLRLPGRGGHPGHVLPAGEPLPARRRAAGARQHLLRRLGRPRQLLPARPGRPRRPRRGLLQGVGLRLRGRRAAAGGQPRHVRGARGARAVRGHRGAALPGLGRGLVGRLHRAAHAQAAQQAAVRRGGRTRPRGARLRSRPRAGRPRGGRRGHRAGAAGHSARDAAVPADAALPGRLPLLQRRHPDRGLAGVPVRQQGAAHGAGHAGGGDPAGAGGGPSPGRCCWAGWPVPTAPSGPFWGPWSAGWSPWRWAM